MFTRLSQVVSRQRLSWMSSRKELRHHHTHRNNARLKLRRFLLFLIFIASSWALFDSMVEIWKLTTPGMEGTSNDVAPRSAPATLPPLKKSETTHPPPRPTFREPHSFDAKSYPRLSWTKHKNSSLIIDPDDPILTPGQGWDASPIVVEKFSLLFFTVPKVSTTVFKQLFRRMMGHALWPLEDVNIPHNPQWNGLKYLYDFDYDRAVEMLTSPNWTRAIFVRDPLERVLSAYLDKAQRDNGTYVKRHCCGIKRDGKQPSLVQLQQEHQQRIQQNFQQQQQQQHQQYSQLHGRPQQQLFLSHAMKEGTTFDQQNKETIPRRRLGQHDMNTRAMNLMHSQEALQAAMRTVTSSRTMFWPQSVPVGGPLPSSCPNLTMDSPISWERFVYDFLPTCSIDPHWKSQVSPWLQFINFVGHFDRLHEDTKRLLKQLGAWDAYGADGWPPDGNSAIFERNTARHKTSSRETWTQYYDDSSTKNYKLRQRVVGLYQEDYQHPLLNLTRRTTAFSLPDGHEKVMRSRHSTS